MSDRTTAKAEHSSRHHKHSKSNKVLRTISFVLTPFLVFVFVCGVFVLALFKPYSDAKPYLDVVFDPNAINTNITNNQVSIYHPDDAPVRIYDIVDEATNEKHTMLYPYYGDLYGTLTISSVGIKDMPIYCGTTDDVLAKGVGWSNSSAFIGRVGNVVLAAHRNTYFANLFSCKEGDIVQIETDSVSLTYIVKETVIFKKDDYTYVNPTPGTDKLTLYTCYGRDRMLGVTVNRFAVICDLVERKWKDVKAEQ